MAMATAFALVHSLFLLLSFTTLITLTTITTAATADKPQPLIMKLIHRDSVLSPYYNPNTTISERAERAIKSSKARLAYLQATIGRAFATDDIRAGLYADDIGLAFLVNFSMGKPPVPTLMLIDTGSSLSWVNSIPCTKCFKQSIPFYDPSKSSTYVNLSCQSPYCAQSPGGLCNLTDNQCTFAESYTDGSITSGNLASEQFIFQTSDEGTVIVPNVVFGCGHASSGLTDGQMSGILGLGTNFISIVLQLGSKFSYCIGNISDPHYIYNQLILGDGAMLEGSSTPINQFNGKYYLTLEGISVGQKRLEISPETFKIAPSGEGGVIIDSGASMTWLVRGGFNPLFNEIQSLLNGVLEQVFVQDDPDLLCYKGRTSRDLSGFPAVTFHFAGGADLVLDAGSMFYQAMDNPEILCMASYVSTRKLSVIGALAQQSYNVGYDLSGNKVSFLRIDCELLEE